MAAASAIYCFGYDIPGKFRFPYFQWLQAARWWDYSDEVTLWVAVGGLIPTAFLALIILAIARNWRRLRGSHLTPPPGGGLRPLERGVTDNHGHAIFANKKQLAERFGQNRGCLIGAMTRDPNAMLLFDDLANGPGHSIVIAGPGSHKTTTAISRIWCWDGPRVVFDPSLEIGPIMTPALIQAGYNVKIVGLNGEGINVLDWIDIQQPEADAHIRLAVEWIYNEGDVPTAHRDPYWSQRGRAMVTCLLAHLLYSDVAPDGKTLDILRQGLAVSETAMRTVLCDIHENSASTMARNIAAGLMDMKADETFSGIFSNAVGATEWLSVDAYADAVSGDTMRTSDILDSKTVVFVQIPLRTLIATPAVGRAVMGAFFNAMFHADGVGIDKTILFQIDEAWICGPMKEIKLCHTTARKYRGAVSTIWQSEGQIEQIWGKDDAKMLRDTVSWRSYNAVQDGAVAEQLSKDIGEFAAMAWSEGSNSGDQRQPMQWMKSKSMGQNISQHEISRRLVKADEIMRAPADEMFVLVRDFPHPIKCVSAPYFRYPDLNNRMGRNRFARYPIAAE